MSKKRQNNFEEDGDDEVLVAAAAALMTNGGLILPSIKICYERSGKNLGLSCVVLGWGHSIHLPQNLTDTYHPHGRLLAPSS